MLFFIYFSRIPLIVQHTQLHIKIKNLISRVHSLNSPFFFSIALESNPDRAPRSVKTSGKGNASGNKGTVTGHEVIPHLLAAVPESLTSHEKRWVIPGQNTRKSYPGTLNRHRCCSVLGDKLTWSFI